ncbi:MAG: M14 family zinc carboxypeptidase, partial [Bacteroidota bacterium]
AIVTAEGLRYEIVIKDVGQYYRDRNNPASIHYVAPAAAQKNANCTEEGFTYPTPSNYNSGSMGGFLTYAEMLAELDEMYAYSEANNLGIITPRADNINPNDPDDLKTFEGRYQQWVMISNNAEAPSTGQPQVFYNAIHHAREPASLQQLVFFMWYLLENYATDAEVRDIVDNTELYFMPCVNPDGYVYNELTDPNGGGFWRKNRRDGVGVDNNRNYNYVTPDGTSVFNTSGVSGDPNGQTYPGTEAFSEPENRGTRYFIEQREFTVVLNNHTFGELLLFPFGYARERTEDDDIFEAISAEMVSANGYNNILSADLYPASGDSDDFGYGLLETAEGG